MNSVGNASSLFSLLSCTRKCVLVNALQFNNLVTVVQELQNDGMYLIIPVGFVLVHGWIMGKELVGFMLVTGTRWPSKKDR